MIERSAILKSLRRIAIGVAVGLVALYAIVFVLLVGYQRDMLFFRGRMARPPSPLYQVRTVTETDGTTLAVWVAPGPHPASPVIVFFHGNAGVLSDFAEVGEHLHSLGYGVVLASYRGYSRNPGDPSEAGLMADARAVLASLPKNHGPVIVWGQSLGTGVAARMASEGRANALILQSPYTSIANVAALRFPVYPVRLLIKDPFDTLSLLPKIKVPVLIMSGTDDEVVPHDMAETLAARFGKQAAFVSIPGGGHDLYGRDVERIAAAWLAIHVKPVSADGSEHSLTLQPPRG